MSLQKLLSYFPFSVLELFPEIAHIVLPVETFSNCSQCVRSCTKPKYPFDFLPDLRCCTFSPTLQNWQLGMILQEGGVGATLLKEELHRNKNHDSLSLRIEEEKQPLFDNLTPLNFGKDPKRKCAFLSQKQCGIWKHRNATCRTWFCVHNDGDRSMNFWNEMRLFLLHMESDTASWCMERHIPCSDQKDWYTTCVQLLQKASMADLSSIRNDNLMIRIQALCKAYQELMPPIPERLRIEISDLYWEGDEVLLVGYSPFAPLRFHRDIFQFLSLLDGDTTWKEALEKSNHITKEPITESQVELLYRRRMLIPCSGSHELAPQLSISFDGKPAINSVMHDGFGVRFHMKE